MAEDDLRRYKRCGVTSWDVANFDNGDLETLFKNGLLSFRFRSEASSRFPKYTLSRFVTNVEVSPKENQVVDKYVLSKGLDCLYRVFHSNKSINAESKKRSLEKDKGFFCASLQDCSPWPMKPNPPSVESSRSKVHEGKIYACLEMYYKNNQGLHVVESDRKFAYKAHAMIGSGSVLFPPVANNEVWSVGFIQYLENDKSGCDEIYNRLELVVLSLAVNLFLFKT